MNYTKSLQRSCIKAVVYKQCHGLLHSGSLSLFHGITPDQREVQELALKFAESDLKPHMLEWDEKGYFPKETLKKAAELGFAAIYSRQDFGGSGMSRLDGSIIFEALSQGCVSTAAYLSIHNMVTWIIDQYGNEEQRKKWIPDLSRMDLFASYCLTEPDHGSDPASLKTTAKRDRAGGDYILNGTKVFISGGGMSDVYAVMCRTGGPGPSGISCLIVEKGSPGLSFGKNEKKLGWKNQPTTSMIFDNCRIPIVNLISNEGDGFKVAMEGLNGGRVNISSCSLGAAEVSFDLTKTYVSERKQFGKTLSSEQDIQFKLASMATELLASRLLVRNAAKSIDDKSPNKAMFCSMAKLKATQTCFDIINTCLQMHGGYGYLKDYRIEQYLRDTRVHLILEGTNEMMKRVIAKHLLQLQL